MKFFVGILFDIISGYEKIIRALVEHGAKVNGENNIKRTPIHDAAYWGKLNKHLQ